MYVCKHAICVGYNCIIHDYVIQFICCLNIKLQGIALKLVHIIGPCCRMRGFWISLSLSLSSRVRAVSDHHFTRQFLPPLGALLTKSGCLALIQKSYWTGEHIHRYVWFLGCNWVDRWFWLPARFPQNDWWSKGQTTCILQFVVSTQVKDMWQTVGWKYTNHACKETRCCKTKAYIHMYIYICIFHPLILTSDQGLKLFANCTHY